MPHDPTIDEIRRIRHEISREVDHDLHRLKKTFELLQAQFTRPSVDYGEQRSIRCAGDTTKSGEISVDK